MDEHVTLMSANGKAFLVDAEDAALVSATKWQVNGSGYVQTTTRPHKRLHRVLLAAPDDVVVDHINGDPSDNRRANLRLCTQSQNMLNQKRSRNNTSGLKGVSMRTGLKLGGRAKQWRASIQAHGKRRWLGYFATAVEAHQAYLAAARELHGEFARTGPTTRNYDPSGLVRPL